MTYSFPGQNSLDSHSYSFRTLCTWLPSLLTYKIFFGCYLDGFSFICDCNFSFAAFNTSLLFFFYAYSSLAVIHQWEFLFSSYVICILCISVGMSFFNLGKFLSLILLKMCSLPWNWDSSSTTVTKRFDLSWCPTVLAYSFHVL